MACEYDDDSGHPTGSAGGNGPTMGVSNGSGSGASLNALMTDEDTEGERKRKRKPNGSGSGSGRKKSDDDELSRTSLVKRIRKLHRLSHKECY